MNKPRVLYISKVLSSYNDPIYQIMNKTVDLTYGYFDKKEVSETTYKTIMLPYWSVGPFVIQKGLRKLINQYDVVIISPHLRLIKSSLLPLFPHKPKLISWSIGLHVTYNKKYDLTKAPDIKDKISRYIESRCDANIFYMPQPIDYWRKYSRIDAKKCFVAHNTVKIADFDELPPIEKRDKFLFVGTLYQQKGLGELIEAYALAKKKREALPKLYIVGKGPEKDIVHESIKEKGLEQCVVMTGAIYEEDILKEYFLTSMLCVSPKQAGLSVQKSLGYGVPFVTRPDAITGGERFDVMDKENGFYYETVEELADLLVDASDNPSKIDTMSKNAREYYLMNATPEKMAQGALDAIAFVMNKN